MDIAGVFAEREWLAISPERAEFQVALRIRCPQHKPRGEWTCEVSLGALDAKPIEIAGMDSWQAVEQAMLHVARRIHHFESLGWQFYWDAQRERAFPTDLYKGASAP